MRMKFIDYNIMENKQKFRPNPRAQTHGTSPAGHALSPLRVSGRKTYCDWILCYIKFNGGKTHPKNMGKNEIEAFLSHLATQGKVSASTQRQALNAFVSGMVISANN